MVRSVIGALLRVLWALLVIIFNLVKPLLYLLLLARLVRLVVFNPGAFLSAAQSLQDAECVEL